MFDFDHTITDLNTDVEVQKLAPGGNIPQSSELRGLYSSQGWTQFMGAVFELLHQNNVTQVGKYSEMIRWRVSKCYVESSRLTSSP